MEHASKLVADPSQWNSTTRFSKMYVTFDQMEHFLNPSEFRVFYAPSIDLAEPSLGLAEPYLGLAAPSQGLAAP